MTDVRDAPTVGLPALAGVLIAAVGAAAVPARRAARLTVSEVLHNE
ncbi:hypothetical protein JS756_06035 [Streptomyces actuosus]|uniref:ABC transporter permease n=1 Tax=Streptomyces actuosus TaxID=1885 RepID=A0ABS2VKV0_STRAS|nr:hypothetical protein [Streptomyces actuosus]MBN0043671.1 hypothetical protein [Streptomyces actuosus]